MLSITPSAAGNNKEDQIIALVRQIIENSSLLLYADLWRVAGFAIIRNYKDRRYTVRFLQFSAVSLSRQVSQFAMLKTESEEASARQLIDLVVPLLHTGKYHNYFDLWENAGFYITAIPVVDIEAQGFQPNLFLLGAAKCGTTTLHRYLSEIPSICMSWPKEPFFFEAEYELGLDFYRRVYFEHWKGEPIIGDARHRNLYLPFVAKRIFDVNPQAKLIICIRNPIERAYSHWWFWYALQVERLEFTQAIQEDIERIQAGWLTKTSQEMDIYPQLLDWTGKGIYRSYVDSGYYYQQIRRYLEYFPDRQIKIVLFEDLKQDSYALVKELETFIGTNYYTKDNFLPKKENMYFSETNKLKRTPISLEFRMFLREHYHQHNSDLAEYLGRDLSHWQ